MINTLETVTVEVKIIATEEKRYLFHLRNEI